MNDHIEDILKKNGFFVCTTVGVSMYPMLRNRRDSIIVVPVEGRLKKYDVPLYKRGNDYVLHRIIRVKDNGYVIRGDNCFGDEFVLDSQIIGVLDSFYHGKRLIKMDDLCYIIYYRFWCLIYPIRSCLMKIRWCLGRMIRKKGNHE